ncbi:MAG: dTDP-4-dehydrorhamnose 3,5-epimerase [Cytophagaceae bacterium]|nr:dTDP-4-dehydrorhamnose 3,5-epimerase [Cytophagaceae bacterium]
MGNLDVKLFPIQGLIEVIPKAFFDSRGHFFESYNANSFQEIGIDCTFVQDNQSHSMPGVVRGLHFQRAPFAQAKLVRVLHGRILDVAVDLRKSSPTFGQHILVELSAEKRNMLYIPEGFAHGFQAIEESVVMYKCNNFYNKASESGLKWDDTELGIKWQALSAVVSEKDVILPALGQLIEEGDLFE